jgi:hypothetical protein
MAVVVVALIYGILLEEHYPVDVAVLSLRF